MTRLSPRAVVQIGAVAVATVVAARAGRFGRRAAMRGGLAAGMAAAISPNRPLGALAGAAAGASLEHPGLGVPLAIAAVAGAKATRGDAVILAAGAGVALATTRVWPPAPRTVEELRRYGAKGHVERSPDGAGVVIVVNPGAGSAHEDLVDRLRDALPAAHVMEAGDEDDVGELLRQAADKATVALGAAGGDGTLSAAASLAHEHELPLLALPAGTLNHFARDLGLLSVDDALAALTKGHVFEIDLASAGDDCSFVNTCSFGAYTDLVEAREKLQTRIGKWPAVAVALVGVLRKAEPLSLTVDGKPRRLWLGFIGNCRYHPSGFAPSWREVLDDGQLDIRIVDAEQPLGRIRLVVSVLVGRLGRSTVYEQRRAELLELANDAPLTLACDGEVVEVARSVTVRKRSRPLAVYAPHR